MTHCGGLSLCIIIWRIGGEGAKFPFALGPKNYLGGLAQGPHEQRNPILIYVCCIWYLLDL